MAEFVRVGVAMNESDAAMIEAALEGRVRYYLQGDYSSLGGAPVGLAPVYVAKDQLQAAVDALKEFALDHLLKDEFRGAGDE